MDFVFHGGIAWASCCNAGGETGELERVVLSDPFEPRSGCPLPEREIEMDVDDVDLPAYVRSMLEADALSENWPRCPDCYEILGVERHNCREAM